MGRNTDDQVESPHEVQHAQSPPPHTGSDRQPRRLPLCSPDGTVSSQRTNKQRMRGRDGMRIE